MISYFIFVLWCYPSANDIKLIIIQDVHILFGGIQLVVNFTLRLALRYSHDVLPLKVHSLIVVIVKLCFVVYTTEVYLYFNILSAQMCLNEPQFFLFDRYLSTNIDLAVQHVT